MAEIAEKTVEQKILDSLGGNAALMDLDQLVDAVIKADADVRPVDVKIAALGLVSKGAVELSDGWQLHRPQ